MAILWYQRFQTSYLEGHVASVCLYATVVMLVGGEGRWVILNPIKNHHIYS